MALALLIVVVMAFIRRVRTRGQDAAMAACLWMAWAHGLAGQAQVGTADATKKPPAFAPMTERERLRQYAKDTVNPVSLLSSAASAGIGQWRDRPPEWNQGGSGYGWRFGSAYAEHMVRQTLMFAASSGLHEDNRYFRRGGAGFKTRLGYAVESTFLARHDDGSRHVSISKIGAFAGAALISRAWQPPSSGSLRGAGANFGISLAIATGLEAAREFLPDLLHRKRVGGSGAL